MDPQWTHCYRMRPYFRNVGLICTAFFAVVGLASTLAAYFNIDGSFARPRLAALVFGVFWSAWSLLGIWLLLLYYRYRLFVNESTLRQMGVVRDRQAELELIHELKWRRFPKGGSVRLSGLFGVLKIELGNFQSVEREQLMSFLREAVAETNQIGWEQFQEQFRDSPQKKQRSRRARFLIAFVFAAHAIAFGVLWAVGCGMLYLAMSVVNALMAVYLFRSHSGKHHEPATIAGEQTDEREPE